MALMSDWAFLLAVPDYVSFAEVAIAVEKILHIYLLASILNCRRSMKFA